MPVISSKDGAVSGWDKGMKVRENALPVIQDCEMLKRLSENAHLPFDKLMALSKVEGLRYPRPPPC